jgi:tryptophan-rich sensory protein
MRINPMKIRSLIYLLGSLALVAAVSITSGMITTPKIPGWYAQLQKPFFTPPAYVFPIVWPILYAMMAVALWRLLEAPSSPLRGRAIMLFLVQLALNAAWSWVFFHFEAIKASLAVIGALAVMITATIYAAGRVSRLAAWLLAPYLLWVLFATLLNAEIARMNP